MTDGKEHERGPGIMTVELDRRAFMAGAGAAAAGCVLPAPVLAVPADPDALVVVNGWVCRREELASAVLPLREVRTRPGPYGILAPVHPTAGVS